MTIDEKEATSSTSVAGNCSTSISKYYHIICINLRTKLIMIFLFQFPQAGHASSVLVFSSQSFTKFQLGWSRRGMDITVSERQALHTQSWLYDEPSFSPTPNEGNSPRLADWGKHLGCPRRWMKFNPQFSCLLFLNTFVQLLKEILDSVLHSWIHSLGNAL